MHTIVDFEVESDEVVGQEGGFLGVRRLRLRNRRDDGSLSERYTCDFLVRPYGIDAVVVALYTRAPDGGVRVLLREGLRPPLYFGRPDESLPVPDARRYRLFTELVAGIIEAHDQGLGGIRKRAAEEAHEEAGYAIDAGSVHLLGTAFPSPGAMAERFWLTCAEVEDPEAHSPPGGDGSPMEEGARVRWMALDDAIAACTRGDIEDAKTELALRRLADRLRD
ncbi:NUDIX hydrolase [Haliangium ochraceum]|uniref:NUDIX hydrolase n=1 Tax=Haliangium ochraceum (strain DSM 14365 / JCM 11303 / SMP-2) TaxID=502025 RepID=D0LTV9_HALO1|nr:NUDIX hydrolase [Haliangium ochraceum]ACY15803.1 NUDIX hydrolase [Haliangium ochraceum DSM 14365]